MVVVAVEILHGIQLRRVERVGLIDSPHRSSHVLNVFPAANGRKSSVGITGLHVILIETIKPFPVISLPCHVAKDQLIRHSVCHDFARRGYKVIRHVF